MSHCIKGFMSDESTVTSEGCPAEGDCIGTEPLMKGCEGMLREVEMEAQPPSVSLNSGLGWYGNSAE